MKLVPALAFALAATVSLCAGAAQYSSDQERRDQNREEALAKWHAQNPDGNKTAAMAPSRSSRGETLRERGREGARSVRNFTHRQAEKSRRFTERQDRRYGKKTSINTSPEGGGK